MKRQFFLLAFFFSLFSFQATTAQNCDSSDVFLSWNWGGPGPPIQAIDILCLDSLINLNFAFPVDCRSISGNGSNFKLVSADGFTATFDSAWGESCVGDSTLNMTMRLAAPLLPDNPRNLIIGEDDQGNFIQKKCSGRAWENDTIIIYVRDCYPLNFIHFQVIQQSSKSAELAWQLDSMSPAIPGFHFPRELFSAFHIYRKTQKTSSFELIDSVLNIDSCYFLDEKMPTENSAEVSYLVALLFLNREVAFSDTASIHVVSALSPLAYPVPFQEHLDLALGGDDPKEISIFSSDGKLIFIQNTNAFYIKIPTDAWPKGVYFIRVRGKEEVMQRVVKL